MRSAAVVLSLLFLGCERPVMPAAHAAAPKDDVAKKLTETYATAADWLVSQQDASGAWKQGPPGKEAPSAAYTGLMVTALANAPASLKEKYKGAAEKGVSFLLSKLNIDGSVGEGPSGAFLKVYATGIALMAFSSVERNDKIANAIRGGQSYLKNNQLKEGKDIGGIGYGDESPSGKKGIANLSTTGFGAEGMKMSGLPQEDDFWKLVVQFVRQCQNNSETNTNPEFVAAMKAKGLSIGDDGSLYYAPIADAAAQKAGTRKVADKEVIQGYGAMTYDGIKTYLYAGLKKDSPEVKSAIDWVRKNYSVEAHPGFAYDAAQRHHLRGLYHYYLVMSRALEAYGENPFETFDGKKHDWPKEIAEQLLKSVKETKMWQNENPGWFEGDPVLVTSYVLVTCDLLLKHVK
ncbi:MAG TPA: prenyltransferase/squalene oxidase repeat-containing protein [Planctomycetota bacterium]|jgi:squalene-hopene/tetraprenyl-beta-curcumene cyclase|nr:prenyltransferase/squalene oxidase repeat-containing protein [Planctomycetota bacterium]